MEKWEYMEVGFYPDGLSLAAPNGAPHRSGQAMNRFNELGAEGWELVATVPAISIQGMHRAIFKRRNYELDKGLGRAIRLRE